VMDLIYLGSTNEYISWMSKLSKLTTGASVFQMPFPASLASSSSFLRLRSSGVGSLLFSFDLPHPFFKISETRSMPLDSAVPMSRGTSSLDGREWIEAKLISLPTTKALRNSRDWNAQSCPED